ncbi:MAG: Holliday junction resolvase RuvX, partial [Chloroflexi bacterium]|nr:Holliday junction resolvase RuvX [Chloroflexota bacterium]
VKVGRLCPDPATLTIHSCAMPVLDLPAFAQSSAKSKPLLGFDVGTTTIGLAIADPGWQVASPHKTISRKKWPQDLAAVSAVIRERGVGGLVATVFLASGV